MNRNVTDVSVSTYMPLYALSSQNYLVTGTVFQPIIMIAYNYILKFSMMLEGFVLSTLQAHKMVLSFETIVQGFSQTFDSMFLGYALLLASMVTLFALPFFMLGMCSKNSVNLYKHRICFCIEGSIFVVACMVLVLSIASSIETATNVNYSLQLYLPLARDIIDDLHTFLNLLQIQLNTLKYDLDTTLNLIAKTVKDIPETVTDIIVNISQPIVSTVTTSFIQTYEALKLSWHNSGLVLYKDGWSHMLMKSIEEAGSKLQDIRTNLSSLNRLILSDNSLSLVQRQALQEHIVLINKSTVLFSNMYQFQVPNWSSISRNLNYTVYGSIPRAMSSFTFLDNLSYTIENFTENIRNEIVSNITTYKDWSDNRMANFNNTIDFLLPTSFMKWFRNLTYQVENSIRNIDMKRNEVAISTFSGWIFLLYLPGLHGIFIISLMALAGLIGTIEFNGLTQYKQSIAAKIMRIGMILGLTFMWLDLLIAGLSYIAAVITSMICIPVLDSTIFSQYLDDLQVWENKTWLDTVIKDPILYYPDNFKVMETLKNCEQNKTIYGSLNMNKWTIDEILDLQSVQPVMADIQQSVLDGVSHLHLPDTDITEDTIMLLLEAWYELDLNFTTQLLAELHQFNYLSLIEEFEKTLPTNIKNNFWDVLRMVMDDSNMIETYIIPQILGNIYKLTSLKHYIVHHMNKLSEITIYMTEMKTLINKSAVPAIVEKLNETVTDTNFLIKLFVNKTEQSLTNNTGNCHIIYIIFKKSFWTVCGNGLFLLNEIWASLGLMGAAMLVVLMLSCHIASYLRGA